MSQKRAITFSMPASSPVLSRAARRARGVYYTPPELVELVLKLAMPGEWQGSGERQERRVLDPACGAGEFLVGAAQRLTALGQSAVLHGVDIDASAVQTARQRLKPFSAGATIAVGNALEPGVLANEAFDVIVGNPPYVSIRELAKAQGSAAVAGLRERYQAARGNFDLYALFIERAIALLKPGGRCGLVVPNKWATLDYARCCRQLLLAQTTIEHVVDLAGSRPFARASVYPHVLVFRKSQAKRLHFIQYSSQAGSDERTILQESLSAACFHFSEALDVESRTEMLPLGKVATIACGTAGYAATRIAGRLNDSPPALPRWAPDRAEFITSGNIDRYKICWRTVRYLGRDYEWPWLPRDCRELTPAKRRLIAAPKIVVAGMSRRLEAAIDMGGLALGVQVFGIYASRVDLHYLLGLLNSKLMSYLFAARFAGKRLGGGYLAINKGQLTRLPIRPIGRSASSDWKRQRRISELARLAGPNCRAVDAEIDGLVYELYRVTTEEVRRVEAVFEMRQIAA